MKLTLIVHEELVESATSWDHGEDRHLLVNNDLEKSRAVGVHQPLELILELLGLRDAVSLNAHGFTKLDEVGVLLMGVRETILEKEGLPLSDHTLFLVVQDDDLDTNVELSSGAKLSKGHAERRITIDVDDESFGTGNLCANSGRKTEAHGTSTARSDHSTRVGPAEVLGSPHLVLTDTSGDDGLVADALSELADLVDNNLGLDQAVRALLLISPREALFPVVDLLEPLGTLRDGVDVREKSRKIGGDVTLDSLSSLDDLVDVLRHDLEVNDTTTALSSGSTSGGSETGDVTGDTIIETSTESNDQVCLLHGHVGVGRTVHTQHVERLRIELIKTTKTLESRGNGDVGLVGKLLEKLGTIGGRDDTLTSIDDRFLGNVDKVGRALDGTLELSPAQLACGQAGGTGVRGKAADHGDGPVQGATGNVLGQVNENGTRAAASSNLESLVDPAGQLSDVLDHHIPLGASPRNAEHVGLLECIRTNGRRWDLATENNHRRTIHQGILHRRNDVGGTRA